ncbi:META domain-containing protein [Streptomyces sp. TRM76323]|uniref:META domain-containing protein n=1 Tax=Streptomyces tamarix TaxID=3078565 RepID=A0ABU3QNI8_9ACTN|nr:META domain-containing protein [Streptomyces tamarix]MDT9684308.1 META domain-containing protein [Streptomyces tamarix]
MRITTCLLPVLAATAALAGCSGGSGGSDPGQGAGDRPDIPLAGTYWTIDGLTLDGAEKAAPSPTMYVEFTPDAKVRGNPDCNGFGADLTIDGDTITAKQLPSTLKGCGDAVNAFASDFREVFAGRLTARLHDGGDRLTLTAPDGNAIALSERLDAPLEGTEWNVDTLLEGRTATSLPAGATGKPHLTIGIDRTVRGNLGCNTFTAVVKADGDKLTFGRIALTRRMCAAPQNELEQKLYGTLSSGPVTYRIQQRTLTVTAQDGSGFGARVTAG